MSLTIDDATNAAQSAAVDRWQWAQEFVQRFLRPMIEMQQAQTVESVVMMWEQFPPEVKAMMEKRNPEQYAQIVKRIEELKKNQKRG